MEPSNIDFTWVFLKMIFAMVAVIALAIVILRYVIPRLSFSRAQNARSDLKIVDRIPLEGRKNLYLVQIEGRRFLVASTDHQVNLISELGPVHETKM